MQAKPLKYVSLGHMMREVARANPDRPALMVPSPKGKEFETINYSEFWSRIRNYAAFLLNCGVKKGDKVVILSENCGEWIIAHYACQTLGAISVPIYPTLPADQAQYIARDAGAMLALCGSDDHMAKLTPIEGLRCELLRVSPADTLDEAQWNSGIENFDPNDLSMFIYTSGTTGQPKGAMLTHAGYLTVVAEAAVELEFDNTCVFFDFLPLSHVFEQIASTLCFSCGGCLGINKNLASMANDLVAIRPTAMGAVPRFLESFMDRIVDGMKKQPPLKQKLFKLYISQGVTKARGGFAPLHGILDKIVGVKIRERLGGRLDKVISGGAALPKHVAEFYLALGINILQGYGLTETTGGNIVNRPRRNKYWTVGEPLGIEMKLAEDGEILMRGLPIMKGYYNQPEETAKAIDADGWFHTGDIGEMDGVALKITDRKKDILVLGNGKNVAPQPLENRIRESRFITEAVVLGDGMDHCIALILPNAEAIRAELGLAEDVSFVDNKEVKALLKKEIDRTNAAGAHFEMIKKWALIDEAFTIDNGMLTPTLKVKRKAVKEKYAGIIESLS